MNTNPNSGGLPTFGVSPSANVTAPTGLSFGAQPTQTPAAGFGFGAQSGGFAGLGQFGAGDKTSTTSTGPATGFSFGALAMTPTPASAASGGFNLSAATAGTTGFSLGTTAAPSQTGFSLGSTTGSPGFATSSSTSSAPTFAQTSTSLSSTGTTGFFHGVTTAGSSTATSTSGTGISLTTPATSGTSFGLPAPTTTGTSFGLPAPATTGTSFGLGTPASTATGLNLAAPATTNTGFNFSTPATKSTGFNMPASSTTGFSMPAATSSGTGSSSSGPQLGLAAPTSTGAKFGLNVPSSTAPSLSLPATTAASSFGLGATTAAPAVPNTSNDTSNAVGTKSSISFAQLDDAIDKWTLEFMELERVFHNQMDQVRDWDRLLLSTGDKIVSLNDGMQKVKLRQQQLDHELDFIVAQQRELVECLVPLEKEFADVTVSDPERDSVYQRSENLNIQLQQISEDLKGVIEHINERNRSQDTSDPIVQIGRILNAHMNSLQWVDQNVTVIQQMLDQVGKMRDIYRRDADSTQNL